jgi:hypothetical protein
VWVGGLYVGEECKHLDHPYVWCPSKEVLSKKLKWRKGEPNIANGKCVTYTFGGSDPGLAMEACDKQKLPFSEHYLDYFESKF